MGVRVRHKGRIVETYLNLRAADGGITRNTEIRMGGWTTDAYLTSLARPEGAADATPDTVGRYFVVAGSYLRKDGVAALESLSKVHALFGPGPVFESWIEGQRTLEVGLRAKPRPAAVTRNGSACPFVYRDDDRLVVLTTR